MDMNSTNRNSQLEESIHKEVSNQPQLTTEQEIELANRIKKGDRDALLQLINGNSRFVVSVAKRYQDRGLTLEKLILAGNKGLELAAKKFDPQLGFKFISYAVWWIRQSILAAIAEVSNGEEKRGKIH
ncbi:MAG: sigma-70 family RNA polymerase sigma factor [Prevotella sp.]|nr:sigma-70 family RNA polymerase sigma factor [Prevotella sp.]